MLEEIFKIDSVKTSLPIPMYTLKSLDDSEVLKGRFYQNEITAVRNQDKFFIESILDTKGKNSYVKWRGYPSRFNKWIPTSNIEKIKENNQ